MNGRETDRDTGSSHSEGEWMARVRSGDPEVLRILLKRFSGPLRRYAERILGGSSDAEEAVQEAFIRLWERRDRWREDGSVMTLLYTLTRNAAVDYARRRHRERPLPEEQHSIIPSPSPTPFEDTLDEELRFEAAKAVSRLPPRRQEVFRLIREDGLTYREVGDVLNIAPQTVANLMSLALADLRSTLGPFLERELGSRPVGKGPNKPMEASGSD